MPILLRSGIDLVEIQRFEELAPNIRERFFQRVFTARELELTGESLASLAGRFAVKEAVAKALGCGIGPVGWKDIEIHRGPNGEPVLELHGAALAAASALGLETWSVSISHTGGLAIASAVAVGPDHQQSREERTG
jgi:holo-[acyl-carrier protein] synthase